MRSLGGILFKMRSLGGILFKMRSLGGILFKMSASDVASNPTLLEEHHSWIWRGLQRQTLSTVLIFLKGGPKNNYIIWLFLTLVRATSIYGYFLTLVRDTYIYYIM